MAPFIALSEDKYLQLLGDVSQIKDDVNQIKSGNITLRNEFSQLSGQFSGQFSWLSNQLGEFFDKYKKDRDEDRMRSNRLDNWNKTQPYHPLPSIEVIDSKGDVKTPTNVPSRVRQIRYMSQTELLALLSLADLSPAEYAFWGHERELGAEGTPPVVQPHGSLREAIAREPERAREEAANMFGLDYYRVLAHDDDFEASGRRVGQKRKRESAPSEPSTGPATKKRMSMTATSAGAPLPARGAETATSALEPDPSTSAGADQDDERHATSSDHDKDKAPPQRPDSRLSEREGSALVLSSPRSAEAEGPSPRAPPKKALERHGKAPSSAPSGRRAKDGTSEQDRKSSGDWKSTVSGRPR